MNRIEELEQGINLIYTKLAEGTMHSVLCNGDPKAPVGGPSCSCPPGREITNLRRALKQLAYYCEHHRFCEITYTDVCTCGLRESFQLARSLV